MRETGPAQTRPAVQSEAPMSDDRELVVKYLRRQLIGPLGGPTETLLDSPHQRYLMGTLFPQRSDATATHDGDEDDDRGGEFSNRRGQFSDGQADDPISLANQYMPSSVALSFLMQSGAPLAIALSAGVYDRQQVFGPLPAGVRNRPEVWVRTAVQEEVALGTLSAGTRPPREVLGGRADLRIIARPFGDNQLLVTVALVNRRVATSGERRASSEDCLFQVDMTCTPGSGSLRRYPTSLRRATHEDDLSTALLYRRNPVWAIGHGCSATWSVGVLPGFVSTAHMPQETIPQVSFDVPGITESGRSLSALAGIRENPQPVIDSLDELVDSYEKWIAGLPAIHEDIPDSLRATADRHLASLTEAARRMREGVRLLERDDDARSAFAYANEAMLMQMAHGAEGRGGRRRTLGTATHEPIDYLAQTDRTWRPFQIAFLLMTLPGLADDEHPDRALVDLIWFPTGGGKTEAYLGAVAFVIALRRIRFGSAGDGTTVITRYTLRLLTTQQFQRASGLICALEILRRRSGELGDTPITIGLWVGGGSTPNTFQDAANLDASLHAGNAPSESFGVTHCAWCGTELIPQGSPGARDFDDPEHWGVRVDSVSVTLFCPDPECAFHQGLPQHTVDDAIYECAPTMVIGTIDKFARLAWVAEAGCILGMRAARPPELVIQDELHLISGPLGSVAGLYEAAFDVAMGYMGPRPKVIASTATISRAANHVAALFGRQVSTFPPPGLSADDSFFMSIDPDRPGRLFVGVLAQGHTPVTANVHTSAALLQAPISAEPASTPGDRYWTLVAYHNSLRELGKTTTLARDDIPSRIKVIEDVVDRRRSDLNVVEITSNVPGAQIPDRLAELGLGRTAAAAAVDVAACTNMLSVGVDIPRLGLMMVVGQPKSTSEYIQATSRVGREFPGLIVALYSSAKARDRSHYESFRAYHSALYAAVEGVSVTPTSPRARERALHAALVVVARHALGLNSDASADAFASHELDLREAAAALADRLTDADPAERDEVSADLSRLLNEWNGRVGAAHAANDGLRYRRDGNAGHALLKDFDSTELGDSWPTLNSMRGVDASTQLGVERRQ